MSFELNYEVGDVVEVSEPKHRDSVHTQAFTGTVYEIDLESNRVLVSDQDDNIFHCEFDEVSL